MADGLADIFNTDLFTMQTLTASVNVQPFVPHRLGELAIFEEGGIPTTAVAIEKKGTTLVLASAKPRGAPATSVTADKRTGIISVPVPHVPLQDAVEADEVQNVRSFGTNNQMRSVAEIRDQKLLKMSQMLDMTLEYHRMGAIMGIALDADGETQLFNSYTAFDIEQPSPISLELATLYAVSTLEGPIAAAITQAKRAVRNALQGVTPRHYWVACSDEFYDDLKNHGEVRSTYLNQQEANAMREDDPLDAFNYSGMTFENYRGIGSVVVPAGKAIIVPMGVPAMFITRFAPAPWFSAVNTIGLPRYSMATLDPTGEKRIDIETQMNPLTLCTRPEALQTFET